MLAHEPIPKLVWLRSLATISGSSKGAFASIPIMEGHRRKVSGAFLIVGLLFLSTLDCACPLPVLRAPLKSGGKDQAGPADSSVMVQSESADKWGVGRSLQAKANTTLGMLMSCILAEMVPNTLKQILASNHILFYFPWLRAAHVVKAPKSAAKLVTCSLHRVSCSCLHPSQNGWRDFWYAFWNRVEMPGTGAISVRLAHAH